MTRQPKADTGRALEGRTNFGAATGVVLERLVRRFLEALRTADGKEFVADLTEDEAAAILFFASIPNEMQSDGRLHFAPASIVRRCGGWTALYAPNGKAD